MYDFAAPLTARPGLPSACSPKRACNRLGLKLLRGTATDGMSLYGLCTGEGAGVEQLKQRSGLTRFEGQTADLWVRMNHAQGFDTLAVAKAGLGPKAVFRISACDNARVLLGLSPAQAYWDAASAALATQHQQALDGKGQGTASGACGCYPENTCQPSGQPSRQPSGQKFCRWNAADIPPYSAEHSNSIDPGRAVLFTTGIRPVHEAACHERENSPTGETPAGETPTGETPAGETDLVWQSATVIGLPFVRLTVFDPEARHIDLSRLFLDRAWQGECDVDAGWGIEILDSAQTQTSLCGTHICGCGFRRRRFTGTWTNAGADVAALALQGDFAATGLAGCQEFYLIPCVSDPAIQRLVRFWGVKDQPAGLTVGRQTAFGNRYSTTFSLTEARAFRSGF